MRLWHLNEALRISVACAAVVGMTLVTTPAWGNRDAANTTNADQLWPGGALGYNLTGAGVTVGVFEALDNGNWRVRSTHEAFTHGQPGGVSRLAFPAGQSGGFSGHSTHVAGTIGGAHVPGRAPFWGMAPGVELYSYSASMVESRMAGNVDGLDITNHSYGIPRGLWEVRAWNIPSGLGGVQTRSYSTWEGEWDIIRHDPAHGRYGAHARALDTVLVNQPNLLSIWAAGNERGSAANRYTDLHGDGRYVARFSQSYINQTGVDGVALGNRYFLISAQDYPLPGLKPGGYDSLTDLQTAKNSLVVGAVNDHTFSAHSPALIRTSTFTSYGPTNDGRLGIDVVANGTTLRSASNLGDAVYISMSGTSMAAPNAAGTAALLLQHWRDSAGGYTPNSASMKGLLMHTATDVIQDGQIGPDYRSGYGLINAVEAARFIDHAVAWSDDSLKDHFREDRLSQGEAWSMDLMAAGGALKASLSWLDPVPSFLQSGLDDRRSVLVNNLDLWITDGNGTVYFPWTLDVENPDAPAKRDQPNRVDNFIQVLIDDLPPHSLLTLNIDHFGPLRGGQQDFSLFVSGAYEMTSVPEPASLALMVLGAAVMGCRRLTASTATSM
ncbi:MAG: S8 family serine peptidase [Phycisphaeraceae bacterium]|nr:S8 family serine peptidase [Phycisphaeraceae bacterium]